MPVGFTKGGLPVGLQLVASSHDEASILSLSAAYQKVNTSVTDRRPDLQ
jgi:aspartyl-tRNA(Asn)/glutamyl-tRNA(Gln) amidotransferase subunit A